APFFVGAAAAPRFAGPAAYPHDPARPMHLAEVRQLDDVVLLRYLLGGDGPAAREQGRAPARGGQDAALTGARGGPGAGAGPPGTGAPGTGAEATGADWAWLAQAIDL